MKTFISLIFTVTTHISFSQDTLLPCDSLKKYSYTLLGFSNNPNTAFGTCFFISKNNNLYLITAKHVLYECDTVIKKEYPIAKFGIVFVPQPFNAIQFPVPQQIDTCLGLERDTDLLVLKLDKRLFKNINTVEKFILSPFNKLGDAEIFGQGMKIDTANVAFDNQHHIHLPRKTFKLYTSMPIMDGKLIDSIHYVIDMKKIRIGNWLKGFSGSPIFLQDYKTKKWRLGGVIVQGLISQSQKNKGAILAVKPEYIFQAIKQLE